jgi:hypothetical protein
LAIACSVVHPSLDAQRENGHVRGDYSDTLLGNDSERFVRSLYVLIKKAIFDGKGTRGRYLNSLISAARRRFQSRTWASFNWDCVFEASYYYQSGPHYLFRHNPRVVVELDNWNNRNVADTFLKLHGGINWWYDNGQITYLPFARGGLLNPKWAEYERGEATGQPVILEPSYYKYADQMYDLLRGQWDHFVHALLEADAVVVIGYSLPEADSEARRALTLGFQSNPTARWLVIDRKKWVCERYERLFGPDRLQTLCVDLADVRDDAAAILDLVTADVEE